MARWIMQSKPKASHLWITTAEFALVEIRTKGSSHFLKSPQRESVVDSESSGHCPDFKVQCLGQANHFRKEFQYMPIYIRHTWIYELSRSFFKNLIKDQEDKAVHKVPLHKNIYLNSDSEKAKTRIYLEPADQLISHHKWAPDSLKDHSSKKN